MSEPSSELVPASRRGSGIAHAQGVTENDKSNGQFRRRSGHLTAKQMAFVRAAVANGGNWPLAAKVAGYEAWENEGTRLKANPVIAAAIRVERTAYLESGACEAIGVLSEIMRDRDINPETRYKAARWFLEAAGHGAVHTAKRGQDEHPEDKPLSEMSIAELDAFIQSGHQTLAQLEQKRDQALSETAIVGSNAEAAPTTGSVPQA